MTNIVDEIEKEKEEKEKERKGDSEEDSEIEELPSLASQFGDLFIYDREEEEIGYEKKEEDVESEKEKEKMKLEDSLEETLQNMDQIFENLSNLSRSFSS